MILKKIEIIKKSLIEKLLLVKNQLDLKQVYDTFLSKKSKINQLIGELKNFTIDERKKIYEIRSFMQQKFNEKVIEIKNEELKRKIINEKIDISLPANNFSILGINPLYLVEEEIINIFLGLGFSICESNDIDSDHYNFELMNIPKDHVVRDMQDTFYLDNELLMCTHTSHVQAHVMEEFKGQPIRIISPGKCFRRDEDDLTHSHQFMQIEGLLIDENINLGHLKKILEFFIKKIFGLNRKIRMRNSYFPFTEPSIEIDISCDKCNSDGCVNCKNTGYIEILGAGIVNPKVLIMNGYDPKKYSGFAFGIGIERIAILKYGIDDIRRFYVNDIRFLNEFKKM